MTRRCKAGQRARIIDESDNYGKVVLIVRYYFGEEVAGATWPEEVVFPWVVASLGSPLRSCYMDGTEAPPAMTMVCEDADLEPLPDDDPDDSTKTDRPVGNPSVLQAEAARITPTSETREVSHG